ncbi:unnamed protein product (macronuclear) [Paramecium tetraurelia]|uniref:Uncharacterized protein n=1 Tax=Paramecium tetraurelia TaxID=5888 RepID=A0BUI9_PARTE|nr:uncharacterized protein GSPATT00005451001 [Paramecium tetraurelia]CAK62206.1 unnamed protein product [Paramecium tetraurelia]|eukprot:XP_001429604.1 hypothetical protein (macronuclear) [Paramecium tetraurelia strain d4-2]
MKIIFYFACFTIAFAQDFKTIFTAFVGSNWNDQEWFYSDIYGGIFGFCENEQLFGGHYVFGKNSLASRQFILPPHYYVKIQLRFWKIDSWDGEVFQLIADQKVYSRQFWPNEGGDFCGRGKKGNNDLLVNIEVSIEHNSQLFALIMTSNLDEHAYYVQVVFRQQESWGINWFELSILECFLGCLSCEDSTSSCLIWSSLASYWQTQMSDDGWLTNGGQIGGSNICGGLLIVGGTSILMQGQSLEKTLKDLPIHYLIKFVFKIWAIGEWEYEKLELQVDNQVWMSESIQNNNPVPFDCGIKQKVSIVNTHTINNHTQNEMNIVIKSNQSSQKPAFWVIQSLDIYIAECSIGCQECFGTEPTMCTKCIKKWGFYQNQCIIAPPIECANVRIVQFKDQNINNPDTFQITIDEVNQNSIDKGQQKLFVSSSISTLTFKFW